jgi:hypothetical protein
MIASAAVLAGTVLPAHAATPGWRQVYSHHYGAAANFPTYAAVAALSPTSAWALGGTDASYGTGTTQVPVILHWNGKAWSASGAPSGVTGTITAVSAPAANDIWAITGASGWILHYDGHVWRVAKHITGFGQLTGVTAVSPTNVWVFGGPGADPGLGTWHYNGKTWAHLTTGSAWGLESASAVSARDIWAVGSTVSPGSSIDRFNGSAWTQVSAKSLPPGQWQYTGIWASSDKNVWVSASLSASNSDVPYLLHYNGITWSKWALPWAVTTGNVALIAAPTPDGAGGLWFTGFTMHNGPGNDFTRTLYVVHRSASGTWGRVKTGSFIDTNSTFTPSGADLGGLALVPGTRSLWGVGFTELPTIGGDAVIWAYGAV